MKWYHYFAAVLAGVFLASTVPHFIHSFANDQTPLASEGSILFGSFSPSGLGMTWAMVNLVLGYFLLKMSRITNEHNGTVIVLFSGIILTGLMLSSFFAAAIIA
jgi:hypothetical protein